MVAFVSIHDVPTEPLRGPRRTMRLVDQLSHPIKGFTIDTDDASALVCRDIRGFREAMIAAADPHAPMPGRLALVVPDAEMSEWLRRWSEDSDRIRRTLRIRRLFDGRDVTVVGTLASYGSGVDTSLCVESITTAFRPCTLVRSGVHPKAALDAALERAALQSVTD